MTVAEDADPATTAPECQTPRLPGWIGIAGVASLGAGAIHAAAIGVHAEHRPAALAFAFLAIAQLGWGGLALVRSYRLVALTGAVIGFAAVGGWAVAKTSGIGFVDGLDVAEPLQTADGLAAGLAMASILAVAIWAWARRTEARPVLLRVPTAVAALSVTALTGFGMVSAGTHAHTTGVPASGHGGTETAAADGGDHAQHADTDAAVTETAATSEDPHADAATVPYDPTKPIDLGGVEGVTPQQQAAAENLVATTLTRLPQWADPAVAEKAGFRSIGDGGTGVEHFVHTGFMEDDVILDPDQPESLVYDTKGGGRRLVAAMYMVAKGTPLEDVPDVGGALMQWHTHENLCFNAQGKVAGITDAAGNCPARLAKPVPTPMIHVWTESHPCGPFAALEGIGGGRIPDGETKLCDHAHGA